MASMNCVTTKGYVIRNRSAAVDKMAASIHLPSHHIPVFGLRRQTQKKGANKNRVFCRSDAGQNNRNKSFPRTTR
jgi:hypothetical protein